MFICGSGSFTHHQDEDDDQYNSSSSSPCPTPKRSKRSSSFCKIMGRTNTDDKNPYAKRGLDKFYALLAEHDDKKQKIYKEMGSEDISFVRFVYPHDSDGPKPIIVKVNHKDDKKQSSSSHEMMMSKVEAEEVTNPPSKDSEKGLNEKNDELVKKKRRSVSSYVESLKKPYFYLPFLVVSILVFLAIYGRSFAILCTSIGWYMVPTMSSSPATPAAERKLKRKKEYARKKSEKHMSPGPSSPKSVINGLSSSELRRR